MSTQPQTVPLQAIVSSSGMPLQDVISRINGAPAAMSACPVQRFRLRLGKHGLRPTRQRMLLGWLLFGRGHRHVSAEDLYEEATQARAHLSLATVYNTLRQFSEAGLIRQVPTGGGKAFFDTNAEEHHHYLAEGEDRMWDAPPDTMPLVGKPVAPEGYVVAGVDVIVRLRKIDAKP
jgi:Fur family transcriptional regulator, iron response regulator